MKYHFLWFIILVILVSCSMETCPTYSQVRVGTTYNQKQKKVSRNAKPYYKVGKFAERD